MDGFFLPQVLDTRLLVLTESRVENPHFYVPLRRMGFTNLPNFSTMAAGTFSDVVVSHQPFTDGLLFHELVHVEQYRQLGIPRFAELYVHGFLNGGGYDGIPLGGNSSVFGRRHFRGRQHGEHIANPVEFAPWMRDASACCCWRRAFWLPGGFPQTGTGGRPGL
jgi:hypothetical protein